MPIKIHLDQLKNQDVHLSGELPAAELDLAVGGPNDLIRSAKALHFQLDASRTDDSVFVHGSLKISFTCDCARCLEPFVHTMEMPNWSCILPLKGDDAIEVIGEYADLTPWMREDILLGLPHHPLCDESCRGLVFKQETLPAEDVEETNRWSALDQWQQQR